MNSNIKNAILFLGICLIISWIGMTGVTNQSLCNITQEDWSKTSDHGKYKTLDQFKKDCNDLLTQGQIIEGILPYLAMICIIIWAIATFRKKKDNKPKEKSV